MNPGSIKHHVISSMRGVSSENVFEEVAKYANPTRRTFLLGLLGAAITAPAVVSFFGRSGQALGSQSVSPTGGLWEWNNSLYWQEITYLYDPSANWPADPSANFMCDISANYPYYSANPLTNTDPNASGNYWQDIYMDASANSYVVHEVTGNAYYEPSGNWVCDPQGQFLYNPSGNWTPLSAPPSGNTPTTVPNTQAPTTTTVPSTTTTTPVVATESTKSTTPKKLPETR